MNYYYDFWASTCVDPPSLFISTISLKTHPHMLWIELFVDNNYSARRETRNIFKSTWLEKQFSIDYMFLEVPRINSGLENIRKGPNSRT